MATFSASWTEAQTLHASSSVATGSSAQDSIDLDTLGAYAAHVQVDLDISAGTPNGDVTVEVFKSPNSGTSVDTEPAQKFVIPFTATGSKVKSFTVLGPWARVKVSNETGESVTYVGLYAYLKQTSA